MFYYVGDIDLLAINTCFRESFVEQAAGGTDKGFAFQIFLIARLFTDENNFCVGRTFAEYGLRGVLP